MPKAGEKSRKRKALSQGQGVKPPKKWWDKTKRSTEKEYPNYGKQRVARIVGGIWSKSSVPTKKKIVKEYQR